MGIPRKKSRAITVNEVKYRWLAKDGGSRYMGESDVGMKLIVQEDAKRPGRVLSTWLRSKTWPGHSDFADIGLSHKVSLTPKDVRRVIEQGLKDGWNPSDRGPAFVLKSLIDLTDYETTPDIRRSNRDVAGSTIL